MCGIFGCSDFFFIKKSIAKRKIRVEKIELELIMSDIAIGYLGALIFFAKYEKNHGYCPQGGYFLVKHTFINQ